MQRCILAVGHLRQVIMRYFGDVYAGMELVYSEEEEPLGTGGGIRQAVGYLQGDEAFVINGDTFFGGSAVTGILSSFSRRITYTGAEENVQV